MKRTENQVNKKRTERKMKRTENQVKKKTDRKISKTRGKPLKTAQGGKRRRRAAPRASARGHGEENKLTEEKLMQMEGYKRGPDYIEVLCGCTQRKFGDLVGALRVYSNGTFLIACECSTCWPKGARISPYEFEKHADRKGKRRWASDLWVMIGDMKVKVWKSGLLTYYKHAENLKNRSTIVRGKQQFHRDEFITCTRCKKDRRFRLRTPDEFRLYHDALAIRRWKCPNWPYARINCDAEEERASRRVCKGCTKDPKCQGCTSCVCFGCYKCRFKDCECRTCTDFMENAQP